MSVEAAFAVAALVAMMLLCAAGLQAVGMQVRCMDAAREAARLVARGDENGARQAAQRVGPTGSRLAIRHEAGFAIARVSSTSRLLPAITIAAEAVSSMEPGA